MSVKLFPGASGDGRKPRGCGEHHSLTTFPVFKSTNGLAADRTWDDLTSKRSRNPTRVLMPLLPSGAVNRSGTLPYIWHFLVRTAPIAARRAELPAWWTTTPAFGRRSNEEF